MKKNKQALNIVQVGLFAALIIIMAFTPFLGYIPLGFTRATIIHIPVIIGSILIGPKKGAVLGGVFGLTSFINNTLNPTPTSFVFTPFYELGDVGGGIESIIICFLPRILVGVFPYFVFRGVLRFFKDKKSGTTISLGVAGLVGSLTNTILVMGLICVFFKDAYATANSVASDAIYNFIFYIIGINGVPEAIVAAIIVSFVGKILLKTRLVNG